MSRYAQPMSLTLAEMKMNDPKLLKVFNKLKKISNISDKKNIPFMGWQFEENFFWPNEKPTWTSAALIIAADSIYDFSDGSDIFKRNQL